MFNETFVHKHKENLKENSVFHVDVCVLTENSCCENTRKSIISP